MTALSSRLPRASAAPWLADSSRGDRRIFVVAALIAVLAHVGILVLPLPDRARPVSMPPSSEGPRIRIVPVPPPPLPDRPRSPQRARRPLPLVAEQPFDTDPIEEPSVEAASEERTLDFDAPPSFAVEPPVLQAVFDETQADLIRPRREAAAAEPEYPRVALLARSQGTVVLRARISETGSVDSIEVLRAPLPDLGFSAAAVQAVSTWRYTPGRYAGRAVAVNLTVVVEFRLEH